MSDNRFSSRHYNDALQYAKEILSSSSSIQEIMDNITIKNQEKLYDEDEAKMT